MKSLLITRLLALIVFLAGCQSNPPTQVSGLPTVASTEAPTQAASATATDMPTATDVPTATSVAPVEVDATVVPTDTEEPERDALEEIVSILLAMNDQDSFRVEQVVNSPEGTTIQYVDVILPDQYHMTNPDMEMIIIENSAWVKTEEGWFAAPGDGETIVKSFTFITDEDEANEFRDTVTSAGYHGEDTLNGEPVYVYTFGLFKDGTTSDQSLWVAISDGLPRRMEMNIYGEGGQVLVTNSFYDYNEQLVIPVPE